MQHLSNEKRQLLLEGTAIPAHPLALTEQRTLDAAGQKLLTKYYLAAGVGGIAIGVHTTQFAIRDPKHNIYEQVLRLGIEAIDEFRPNGPILKIAGVSGDMKQACDEAVAAKSMGYDLALVSTNGLSHYSEQQLIERANHISEIMPIFGFYLQPAVGGRVLNQGFWSEMANIKNLLAIKIAPFNRYQTLDVVRAVCESERGDEIALYTGNDDNILLDLLSTYEIKTPRGLVEKEIVGGLLGHWAVWTRKAVDLLIEVKNIKASKDTITKGILSKALKITDSNAAFFDAKNNYAGCIAGLHEILRRQGLMKNIYCLDPEEGLSNGQLQEIDRVYEEYPDLNDDRFVAQFLESNKPQ